jgi:hypothetical protein
VPASSAEAVELAEAGSVARAQAIQVRHVAGEPYDRIIAHTLGDKPPALADGDMAGPEPEYVPATAEDEIPF